MELIFILFVLCVILLVLQGEQGTPRSIHNPPPPDYDPSRYILTKPPPKRDC
jgi:hypothetical protein